MSHRVYIKNLPIAEYEEDLEKTLAGIFSEIGEVICLKLIFEGSTWRPKGLCFVEMKSHEHAHAIVTHFNGFRIADRTLEVGLAYPRLEPRSKQL